MLSERTTMPILNIFANFFIDSEERFLRMKDSFNSFSQINADTWVINCRGRYRDEVLAFLKDNLGDKLIPFKLNSKEGWFHDTRKMLSAIKSEYVLFWLEDHINLAPVELLDSIVAEMKSNELEYMLYSFWQFGKLRDRYDGVELNKGQFIDYFVHNVDNNSITQGYIISAASILSSNLFRRIIMADDPVPKRWPKETPFDFEKAPSDIHWLPIKTAVLREELFASIDDDHGTPGYSLQSRGLYPLRVPRQTYTKNSSNINKLYRFMTKFKDILK